MDNRIRQAYDYIKRHFGDELSLSLLADHFNLSTTYFQKLFKREMHETPAECIERIRLEYAAHLMLIDEDVSMTAIADRCGFSSLAVFSRSFSKRFGQAPSVYSTLQRKKGIERVIGSGDVDLEIIDPEIIFLRSIKILYRHTSVFNPLLVEVFDSVKAINKLPTPAKGRSWRYGVYTHIHLAFHGKRNELNYYAGCEINSDFLNVGKDQIFVIPEGRYASFTTSTSYLNLYELAVHFKTSWMDPRSLVIRDTYSVEAVFLENKVGDHPSLKRRFYIPIK